MSELRRKIEEEEATTTQRKPNVRSKKSLSTIIGKRERESSVPSILEEPRQESLDEETFSSLLKKLFVCHFIQFILFRLTGN